jgi:hypothetical protein
LLVHDEALFVVVRLIHEVLAEKTLSAVLADPPAIRRRRPDIVEEATILLEVSRENGHRMLAEDELPIGIAIDVLLQDVILHDRLQIPKLVAENAGADPAAEQLASRAMHGVGLSRGLLFREVGTDRLPTACLPDERSGGEP